MKRAARGMAPMSFRVRRDSPLLKEKGIFMCLITCVANANRAVFLSDGFVLGPNDKPVQRNFSKLFHLRGGQILAAIGTRQGIDFARSLQNEVLNTRGVYRRIREFTERNPISNCFMLAGIVDSKIKVFQWSFDGTDWHLAQSKESATGVATFIDGFFTDREKVKHKLDAFDHITDINLAASEMRKLFDEIRAEYPNKIGGETFGTEITLHDTPNDLHYARVSTTALSGNQVDLSQSGVINKSLDHITDGSGRYAVGNGAGLKGVASVDGSNLALVDFSQAHTNKNLDNISDTSDRYAATGATMSYRPLSNPLTATDAGSTATITITAFTMRIAGKGDISVSGASLTGKSYNTTYYIYYDDANIVGGTVSFQYSTTKEDALNGSGRFYVGSIITPPSGGADTIGNNDGGTGAQAGSNDVVLFSNHSLVFSGSIFAIAGAEGNINDGNSSTFFGAQLGGASSSSQITVSFPQISLQQFVSATLYMKTAVPTNKSGSAACETILSYSTDNGATWTTVFNISTGTRALSVDSVTFTPPMNLGRIQVRFETVAGSVAPNGGNEADYYESWIVVKS